MNPYLLAAAVLLVIVGIAHSVQGERLMFRRLRKSGWIPTDGGTVLREPHVRILWATWHFASVMGFGMAAVLSWLAGPAAAAWAASPVVDAIALSMAGGALIVFVGTRARHPGWVGLLGVAILAALGRFA